MAQVFVELQIFAFLNAFFLSLLSAAEYKYDSYSPQLRATIKCEVIESTMCNKMGYLTTVAMLILIFDKNISLFDSILLRKKVFFKNCYIHKN